MIPFARFPRVAASSVAVVLLTGLISLPQARAAAIFCVKPGGGGGCSATIQGAVTAASPGDTVRVAKGTYTESVLIDKTVILLGGWNLSFTKRAPKVNITTIVSPAAAMQSVVTIQGVFGNPSSVAPRVDGFTITGGNPDNHGGGMRIVDSNATISKNLITNNIGYLFGGGVWVQRGAPTFSGNTIANNHVTTSGASGGGIELESTQATLANNIISNNVVDAAAGQGGGLAIEGGGPVTLTGNEVRDNAAATTVGTGTDFGYGGGIWVDGADFSLKGGLIQNNAANSYSAKYGNGEGGGLYVSDSQGFSVSGTTINGNTGGWSNAFPPSAYLRGGGVLIVSSSGTLRNVTVSGNQANRYLVFGNGGGLAISASDITVRGGAILNNKTSTNCEGFGGGIYANGSTLTLDATRLDNNCASNTPFYGLGGAFASIGSNFDLSNAILTNNSAFPNDTAVGGIWSDAASFGTVVNCTLAGNKAQAIRSAGALLVRNTIIAGGTTGINKTMGSLSVRFNDLYGQTVAPTAGFTPDATNLSVDPLLDVTYHLTGASPMIDAGTATLAPNHDYDGDVRPLIGTSGALRFDIGADEFV